MCLWFYFGFIQVKLDKLVKPDKAVADYRSDITGITAEDLVGETCSLLYVQVITNIWWVIRIGYLYMCHSDHFFCILQKSLKNLLKNGTILVGHSLNNDLKG